ncbi:unnamed protein product [Cyprideis torosa]|uniref:Flagellar motor switch protein FliG n=1 Tax=Cyprideis torosa TaxID=163714 RepID=A0A7R8W0N0_9CRUS|nr:unnamed protein product [Cyprideis torosa]CAG0878812.1 unnamed protein product [Cyprideis torosa]
MALGEEKAANILKHMNPEEVQSLGEAMSAIDSVTQDQISGILDKFVGKIKNESSLSLGSRDYLKKTLTRALGRDRAGSIIGQIAMDGGPVGLDSLRWMSPRSVANIIYNEHPQIIAIVLAHLNRDQAGKVMGLLPKALHTDILVRITKLETIHPSALQELNEVIQRLFEQNSESELTGIGGISVAAEILNGVSKEDEAAALEKLEEIDSELSMQIQERMFIFENLMTVDDRGMQSLLREVSTDKLIYALKGASQELQEKIFRNMSKRAAEMLKDDLDAKGPVRLAEVEEAQKEILTVALRMGEEGTISYRAWQVPELGSSANKQTADTVAFPYKQENAAPDPQATEIAYNQQDIDEAYQKGLQDGLQQSSVSRDGQAEQLNEIIQALVRPVQRVNDTVEAELVELSLAVAKLILRREISEDPKHIAGLIHEAVKQLPAATLNVRIHLNPDDAVIVQSALAQSEQSSRWSIEPDPTMKPGDCQIRTDTSFIDAGIDGLINRLAAEMLGGHRSTDMNEHADDSDPQSS